MLKKYVNLALRCNLSKLPKFNFSDTFHDKERAEEKNYILR